MQLCRRALASEAVQRRAGDIYLVRCLGLVAAALIMMAIAGGLTFTRWLLSTWRRERLRPALIFLAQHMSLLMMVAASSGLSERHKLAIRVLSDHQSDAARLGPGRHPHECGE
jgi:hypothetical protein